MEATKPSRAGASFVLVTVLLDTLGLGLIIPVAPRLVASLLGDDLVAASHYFGVLVSLYALMQFIFSPVIGGLSDRFGRRPVILCSLFGAAASYVLSGFAPTLSWLFLGRVIAGITGASFSAANAYVADVTPPAKRAQSFGLVGAVFGLGFILGPALGGTLGDFGLRIPYFVAAGLNGLNLLYGFFVLPESLAPAQRRPFSFARANALGSLRALGRHRIVLGLTGTLMCSFMAQWILQSVWALHTQSRFGWTLRQVGLSLMSFRGSARGAPSCSASSWESSRRPGWAWRTAGLCSSRSSLCWRWGVSRGRLFRRSSRVRSGPASRERSRER
jgi:DHA1 family tetracycline resistance protein-like MFS transporter